MKKAFFSFLITATVAMLVVTASVADPLLLRGNIETIVGEKPANNLPTIAFTGTPPSSPEAVVAGSSTPAFSYTVADPNEGDVLTVSASVASVSGLSAQPTVTISNTSGNGTVTVDTTPNLGQTGTAVILLTVSDSINSTSITFTVNVLLNNNPVISFDTSPSNPFEMTDNALGTAIAWTAIDGTVTDTLTITSAVVLGGLPTEPTVDITPGTGTGTVNGIMLITPVLGSSGTATITLSVTDGTTPDSIDLNINVSPNVAPVIAWDGADPGTVVVLKNASTGPLAFSVTDGNSGDAIGLETTATNLLGGLTTVARTLSTSSGTVPINAATIDVTPGAGEIGTALITITATDAAGLSSSISYNLQVDEPILAWDTSNWGEGNWA